MFKGYIVIAGRWITPDSSIQSIVLDFRRYVALHTGQDASAMLLDVIESKEIANKLLCVTSDNASDMCKAMNHMHEILHACSLITCVLENFYMRFIAYMVN